MNRLKIPTTICLLIADQNDRRLLATFLQQGGYGIQLLSAADMRIPAASGSLLIADEVSARRHGAALLEIKQLLKPLYFPVLLTLTGNNRATPWLRAGFDDVLRLPLSKDDLLARLEAFLRLHQHSDEIVNQGHMRYRATFDLAPVGIVHTSLDGHLMLVNPRFCDMLLCRSEDVAGMTIDDLVVPDGRGLMQAAITTLLAGEQSTIAPFDQQYRRRDQSSLWTIVTVSLARDAAGRAEHLIVVIEDISVRKAMENSLRESERFAKSTIDALPNHICVVDENGKLLAVNQAWRDYGTKNGGISAIEWTELNYLDVCDRAAAEGEANSLLFAQGLREVLFNYRDEFVLEYPCHSPVEQRWFLARVTRFPQNGPVRVLVSHEDVTQAKESQQHLTYLAHYDSLTALPNRVLFYERLQQVLLQAARSKWRVVVMFIDLDNFKMVNDTLGHAAGDQLLKETAERIVNCLRSNDTVGRLGGDEFSVFLPDVASDRDASVIAQKIMTALAEPFYLDGTETFITSSIGIALYPLDGSQSDTLVGNADTAMYRAKELGRNNFQYFAARMNTLMIEQARLGNGLRKALERHELYLEYQPQIDIESGRITGVEALMRWRHPELGLVSPAIFIPIAEETGLIVSIGEWAMRTACAQNKAWQDAGIAPIVMAVNLSARQFKHSDMSDMVQAVLQDTGLDGRYLELELTEGIVMDNAETLIATMKRLKQYGVRLSLDDFGTGYSNLGYLRRFPLDMIKIDKSFVNGIGTGSDEGMIAATVITLGHSLKLKVIAEGVETEVQLAALRMLGCDMMQGFLFSRPLPVAQITTLLLNHSH